MTNDTEFARERDADQFARLMARRYSVDWVGMNPHVRDVWRTRCEELLDYLDETAFSLLPREDLSA